MCNLIVLPLLIKLLHLSMVFSINWSAGVSKQVHILERDAEAQIHLADVFDFLTY